MTDRFRVGRAIFDSSEKEHMSSEGEKWVPSRARPGLSHGCAPLPIKRRATDTAARLQQLGRIRSTLAKLKKVFCYCFPRSEFGGLNLCRPEILLKLPVFIMNSSDQSSALTCSSPLLCLTCSDHHQLNTCIRKTTYLIEATLLEFSTSRLQESLWKIQAVALQIISAKVFAAAHYTNAFDIGISFNFS